MNKTQKKKTRDQDMPLGISKEKEKKKIYMPFGCNTEADGESLVKVSKKRWWRFRSFSAPTSPLTSSSLNGQNLSHQSLSPSSYSFFIWYLFFLEKAFWGLENSDLVLEHIVMATNELLRN